MNIAAYPDAVLSQPSADAPRWLLAEACADPDRAALIRVQLQHARQLRALLQTPLDRCGAAGQAAFCDARQIIRRLLLVHAARWTAHLPASAEYHFGRGCVECVTASAAWWLKHGDAVSAIEPILGLTLLDVTPQLLAQVLQKPRSSDLLALALRPANQPDDATCDALIETLLAQVPTALTWLDLRGLPMRLPHHEALARGLRSDQICWVGLPELDDFPVSGQRAPACDEALIEEDWNHQGRLLDWYSSPLVRHLDELTGVAAWRHFRPADWKLLMPPPMTLFAHDATD